MFQHKVTHYIHRVNNNIPMQVILDSLAAKTIR